MQANLPSSGWFVESTTLVASLPTFGWIEETGIPPVTGAITETLGAVAEFVNAEQAAGQSAVLYEEILSRRFRGLRRG